MKKLFSKKDRCVENKTSDPSAIVAEDAPVKKDISTGKKALSVAAKVFAAVVMTLIVLVFVLVLTAALYINRKLNLIDYFTADNEWAVSDSSVAPSVSTSEIVLPDSQPRKDRNVMNILLLGTDERSPDLAEDSRADSIMLLSINKSSGTIKLLSFERSIPVTMPDGHNDLLTHAFHYGGPDYVLECVRTHFNVDVDFFIRVNFDVFIALVDAVGGIDLTLTDAEAWELNLHLLYHPNGEPRYFTSGSNHLTGFDALHYARLRSIDSDWARIERQRKTIKALQQQASTLSIAELDRAASEILPKIQTNMNKLQFITLVLNLTEILNYPIDDMTIPVAGTYNVSCTNVDYTENSRIIEEFLYGTGD